MVCYSNWQVVDSPGLYSVCRAGWYVRETLLVACADVRAPAVSSLVWVALTLFPYLLLKNNRACMSLRSVKPRRRPRHRRSGMDIECIRAKVPRLDVAPARIQNTSQNRDKGVPLAPCPWQKRDRCQL